MTEPWNLKQDDTRHADSLHTFIIFCEDEVSEVQYFKYFETPLIKVNTIEGQKSKFDNIVKAISHCIDQNLMNFSNGLYQLTDNDIHLWCVFDRDVEEDLAFKKIGDIEFDEAIQIGYQKGFNIAWSNDSFELWILLHFEEIDPIQEENKKRVTYYNKLTQIFKNIPIKNDDLIKALSHPTFNYKKDLKHKNNFRNIVRSEIIPKTVSAINRAEKLEEFHKKPDLPNHEKSPYTNVHYLVKELLRFGKKKI